MKTTVSWPLWTLAFALLCGCNEPARRKNSSRPVSRPTVSRPAPPAPTNVPEPPAAAAPETLRTDGTATAAPPTAVAVAPDAISYAGLQVEVDESQLPEPARQVFASYKETRRVSFELMTRALHDLHLNDRALSVSHITTEQARDILAGFAQEPHDSLSALKVNVERHLATITGQPLTYNPAAIQVAHVFLENRVQPYSGTLFLELLRRQRGREAYDAQNPVVIFEDGHMLPGSVVRDPEGDRLLGVEATVAGAGIRDFGRLRDLRSSVRLVDGHDFALIEVLKDGLIGSEAAVIGALARAARKYALPAMEAQSERANAQTPTPEVLQLLGGSPFAFGAAPDLPATDTIAWNVDEIRSDQPGRALYTGALTLSSLIKDGRPANEPPRATSPVALDALAGLGFAPGELGRLGPARFIALPDTEEVGRLRAAMEPHTGTNSWTTTRVVLSFPLNRFLMNHPSFLSNMGSNLDRTIQFPCLPGNRSGTFTELARLQGQERVPLIVSWREFEGRQPYSQELTLSTTLAHGFRSQSFRCRAGFIQTVGDLRRFFAPLGDADVIRVERLATAALRAEDPIPVVEPARASTDESPSPAEGRQGLAEAPPADAVSPPATNDVEPQPGSTESFWSQPFYKLLLRLWPF